MIIISGRCSTSPIQQKFCKSAKTMECPLLSQSDLHTKLSGMVHHTFLSVHLLLPIFVNLIIKNFHCYRHPVYPVYNTSRKTQPFHYSNFYKKVNTTQAVFMLDSCRFNLQAQTDKIQPLL